MKPADLTDRTRTDATDATDADQWIYHRKGWQEPAEAPVESYCRHCHRRVSYLVWRRPEWLCVVCAEAK